MIDDQKNLINDNKEDNKRDNLINDNNKINNEDKYELNKYLTSSKCILYLLFFCLGSLNCLGYFLFFSGASKFNVRDYIEGYSSYFPIIAIIARIINSKFFLKTSYKKRLYFLIIFIFLGYISLYILLEINSGQKLFIYLLIIPLFLLSLTFILGEVIILGYLRLFPNNILAGWTSGTGFSELIGGLFNFLSQILNNFSLKYGYIVLSLTGIIYFLAFKKAYRILEIKGKTLNTIMPLMENDDLGKNNLEKAVIEEIGETEEAKIEEENNNNCEIKYEEGKEFENMNKANKILSCQNFKNIAQIMKREIINLCVIYFLNYLCSISLISIITNRRDIEFLPVGCRNARSYRKGKYEFILLSYQLGMFISKFLFKAHIHIKSLEVYTIIILIINIIFILEYLFYFLPWIVYLILGLIFGFFSGGAYLLGIFKILNSDKLENNNKELGINIALLFCDIGSIFASIIGYILKQYLFNVYSYNLGRC